MKHGTFSELRRLIGYLTATSICLVLICVGTGCNSNNNGNPNIAANDSITGHWNWNIAFGDHTTNGDRDQIKVGMEDSIRAKVRRQFPNDSAVITWTSCPCDPFLANVDVTVLGGSGEAVTTPPTKPAPGPSGDYVLSSNIDVNIPEANEETGGVNPTHLLVLDSTDPSGTPPPDGHVIAFIDTGIDTAVISPAVKRLLWKDEKQQALFNFFKPNGVDLYSDSIKVKHGTAAVAIALGEITGKEKPKIMALKAFDKKGKGTIYTVSCALSYAIQNHVDAINASWGYYGELDSVLYKYIRRADSKSVPIIAAAGNDPQQDHTNLCQDAPNSRRELTLEKNKFYPACLSTEFPNLVTVTGLNEASNGHLVSCFYQNYSSVFVSVGVFNKGRQSDCCAFSVPFLKTSIEGSSFATPVITGRYVLGLPFQQRFNNARDAIESISSQRTDGPIFTRNGSFVIYHPK